jgi:hypothetical protein
MELEDERQRGRLELEGTRQKNRMGLLQEREAIRKKKLDEDKKLSVSQDAAAWKLARQQYVTDNPSHGIFWDDSGMPSESAEDDDTGIYELALAEIRERYNKIKSRASTGPVTTPTDNKVRKQYSPSRNETRISNDGGKTWKVVPGRQ